MDKQKLIDRIINDNHGVNPEGAIWHIPLGGGFEYLFGEKEFNKRAKEMGWANGYKYGVEYATNGEKPDLPDDLIVSIKPAEGWTIIKQTSKLEDYLWDRIESFRIVDDHYKPVEVGQVQATINLPAVGEFVDIADNQFLMYGQGEKNCEVLAHVENTAVVRMSYGLGCFTADNLVSKADEEKKKFVDAAVNIMMKNCTSYGIAASELYKSGCRFTNNKEKQ